MKTYDYGRFFDQEATHQMLNQVKWSDFDLRMMVEKKTRTNPSNIMVSEVKLKKPMECAFYCAAKRLKAVIKAIDTERCIAE